MKKQRNIFAFTESLFTLSQYLLVIIGIVWSVLGVILLTSEQERIVSLFVENRRPVVVLVVIVLIFFVYMNLNFALLKWKAKIRWCEKKIGAFIKKVNAMYKETEAQRVCRIHLKDEIYITNGFINRCTRVIEQYSFDEGMNLVIELCEFDKIFFQNKDGILFHGMCLEEKANEMESLLQYLAWLMKIQGKPASYSIQVFTQETFEIIMSSQKPLLLPEEKVLAEN